MIKILTVKQLNNNLLWNGMATILHAFSDKWTDFATEGKGAGKESLRLATECHLTGTRLCRSGQDIPLCLYLLMINYLECITTHSNNSTLKRLAIKTRK